MLLLNCIYVLFIFTLVYSKNFKCSVRALTEIDLKNPKDSDTETCNVLSHGCVQFVVPPSRKTFQQRVFGCFSYDNMTNGIIDLDCKGKNSCQSRKFCKDNKWVPRYSLKKGDRILNGQLLCCTNDFCNSKKMNLIEVSF